MAPLRSFEFELLTWAHAAIGTLGRSSQEEQLFPFGDRLVGPFRVPPGEQLRGRGAAPWRGQELRRKARVDPREPAPGVHQVDDPRERVGTDWPGEGMNELIVGTGQLVEVPGVPDHRRRRAAALVLGREQVAVREPGLLQYLPHLVATVAARAEPYPRHDVAEPGPAQPRPDHV